MFSALTTFQLKKESHGMFPNVEGYTRFKNIWTGRTTYYRGGSGNPTVDALVALFTMDQASGRLISMIILTPFFTIFSALWGLEKMGSRGGVIFGVIGLIVGMVLGYILAQRFTQLLGTVIAVAVLWFATAVIWSILAQFWYADDPSYPSASVIRADVMSEPLDCAKVESAWKGMRVFELNRDHLDTRHFICQNPDLIRLEMDLNSEIGHLQSLSKSQRQGVQSTLNTFRPVAFNCSAGAGKEQCVREAYDTMFGIIRSAVRQE
jgi:hypothetical protein